VGIEDRRQMAGHHEETPMKKICLAAVSVQRF
jgi:hypothetical protein